jgi:hypothetical protein
MADRDAERDGHGIAIGGDPRDAEEGAGDLEQGH